MNLSLTLSCFAAVRIFSLDIPPSPPLNGGQTCAAMLLFYFWHTPWRLDACFWANSNYIRIGTCIKYQHFSPSCLITELRSRSSLYLSSCQSLGYCKTESCLCCWNSKSMAHLAGNGFSMLFTETKGCLIGNFIFAFYWAHLVMLINAVLTSVVFEPLPIY